LKKKEEGGGYLLKEEAKSEDKEGTGENTGTRHQGLEKNTKKILTQNKI